MSYPSLKEFDFKTAKDSLMVVKRVPDSLQALNYVRLATIPIRDFRPRPIVSGVEYPTFTGRSARLRRELSRTVRRLTFKLPISSAGAHCVQLASIIKAHYLIV